MYSVLCIFFAYNVAPLQLARKAASAIGISGTEPCPSAFQLRFGGYKGVVSVYPKMPAGVCLQLRDSMDKFDCPHDQLEVCANGYCMEFNTPLYVNIPGGLCGHV